MTIYHLTTIVALFLFGWTNINAQSTKEYCTPQLDASSEWIDRVIVNGKVIQTDQPTNYNYSNAETILLKFGADYSLKLVPGFYNLNSFYEAWSVYIDYNNDGDFNDNNEFIFSVKPTKGAIEKNFKIKENVLDGSYRMRIVMQYNSIPYECETSGYGACKDLEIEIKGASNLTLTPQKITKSSVVLESNDSRSWKEVLMWDNNGNEHIYTFNEKDKTILDLEPNTIYFLKGKRYSDNNYSIISSFITSETDSSHKIIDGGTLNLSTPITLTDASDFGEVYSNNLKDKYSIHLENDSLVIGMKVNYCQLQNYKDYLVVYNSPEFSSNTLDYFLTGDLDKGKTFFTSSSSAYLYFYTNSSKQYEGISLTLFSAIKNENQQFEIAEITSKSVEIEWKNKNKEKYFLEVQNVAKNKFYAFNTTDSTIVIDQLDKESIYKIKIRKEGYAFSREKEFSTKSEAPLLNYISDNTDQSFITSWVSPKTDFHLEVYQENNLIHSFSVSENVFEVVDLENDTNYKIRVRSDDSEWSEFKETRTLNSAIINMSTDTIKQEQFTYTDPNGINGHYQNNQSILQVVKPLNEHYVVTFQPIDFYFENGYDFLKIYNGQDQLLGVLTGNSRDQLMHQIISNDSTGQLKFYFESDYSSNGLGWEANIKSLRRPPKIINQQSTQNSILIEWEKIFSTDQFEVIIYDNFGVLDSLITSDNKILFDELLEDYEYSYSVSLLNGADGERKKILTTATPPIIDKVYEYSTLVELFFEETDKARNKIIEVFENDKLIYNILSSSNRIQLYDLNPNVEYKFRARYVNSLFSDWKSFYINQNNIKEKIRLSKTDTDLQRVLSGEIDIIFESSKLEEDPYIYFNLQGYKNKYNVADQSSNFLVSKYKMVWNEGLKFYFYRLSLTEINELIPNTDSLIGLNIKIHNKEINYQTNEKLLHYPFMINNVSEVFQGDSILELNIQNLDLVKAILLNGDSINFDKINTSKAKIILPELLATTNQKITIINDDFYDKINFDVSGELKLNVPNYSILEKENKIYLLLNKVYGCSNYEFIIKNEFTQDSDTINFSKHGEHKLAVPLLETNYSIYGRAVYNSINKYSEWGEIMHFYAPRITYQNPVVQIDAVTTNAIMLSWDKIKDAELYQIDVLSADSVYSLNTNSTTYNLTELLDSTVYSIRVSTVYKNNEKQLSTYFNVNTLAIEEVEEEAEGETETIKDEISIQLDAFTENTYQISYSTDILYDSLKIAICEDSSFSKSTFSFEEYHQSGAFNLIIDADNKRYIRVKGLIADQEKTEWSNIIVVEPVVTSLETTLLKQIYLIGSDPSLKIEYLKISKTPVSVIKFLIYDSKATLISEGILESDKIPINKNTLQQGMYHIVLIENNKKTHLSFIIQ
ncbi:fibronectin type III domain-containing protein [Flammeovirga kamogawensis]|uniref:T9SS type A sorting domain-containing protein n=1 Tax=Flammeovirga kamogawensis TaxID=373891 RepID=A0ABX8H0J9_9BACT|nr:GEVED domain-containing protein [Flammeovirga kamogawensis]MBB6459572.1 hypothetical protein [Flammeovirga kamogawensis]QWG09122.1 hypothetical protein KM029_09295 [Flammeovirga kamogawensis]TRX67410.1 hypothetical protein EO216_04335 [Flammeovirga kamogawensis]